jgi:hypothetical protein
MAGFTREELKKLTDEFLANGGEITRPNNLTAPLICTANQWPVHHMEEAFAATLEYLRANHPDENASDRVIFLEFCTQLLEQNYPAGTC